MKSQEEKERVCPIGEFFDGRPRLNGCHSDDPYRTEGLQLFAAVQVSTEAERIGFGGFSECASVRAVALGLISVGRWTNWGFPVRKLACLIVTCGCSTGGQDG